MKGMVEESPLCGHFRHSGALVVQPGSGRSFSVTAGTSSRQSTPANGDADGPPKSLWISDKSVPGTGAAALGTRLRLSICVSALTQPSSLPILHHMVKFQESQLDRTFAALVDPTRRAILARLEQEESVSIGELAHPFAIKLPAVMKHLDVLGTAGLITRSKKGRTVAVRLAPEPMEAAMNWLRRYERFWAARLDRLAAYAEAEEAKAGEAKAGEAKAGEAKAEEATP
jgi:DNA-binding transcriptional ArsR family regulator